MTSRSSFRSAHVFRETVRGLLHPSSLVWPSSLSPTHESELAIELIEGRPHHCHVCAADEHEPEVAPAVETLATLEDVAPTPFTFEHDPSAVEALAQLVRLAYATKDHVLDAEDQARRVARALAGRAPSPRARSPEARAEVGIKAISRPSRSHAVLATHPLAAPVPEACDSSQSAPQAPRRRRLLGIPPGLPGVMAACMAYNVSKNSKRLQTRGKEAVTWMKDRVRTITITSCRNDSE